MSRRAAQGYMLAAFVAASACSDAAAPTTDAIVRGFAEASGARTVFGSIVFADGRSVGGVTVHPATLSPGDAFTVDLRVDDGGTDAAFRVGVFSPRDAGRQELRNRNRAPVAPAVRGDWIQAREYGTVELRLPSPWHPPTAVVLLERIDSSGARVRAVRGPRTAGGLAVLASVPVDVQPTSVRAVRMSAPVLDGRLDEWTGEAAALVRSQDGEPDAGNPTRVWFGWDAEHLYAAAELPDQDIFTPYDQHDDPLYKGEVFELFIAGTNEGRQYIELQVSAKNVTFDAHFPSYRRGDESWNSAWRTAVDVRGTLDNRKDRDEGWGVEVAVPWVEICEKTQVACPPQPGQALRLNAFRLEHPKRGPAYGLALSPTRKPDFHAWANAAILELGT